MFGIFRREKKSERELASEKLLAMPDVDFVDVVRSVVCQFEPSARVMLVVAINVLPIFLEVFAESADEALPNGIDEFIMFCSKENKAHTEGGERRMLWLLQAAFIHRASLISMKRDDIFNQILDIWISLIESGKVIDECLKHNIIWEDDEKAYFNHIKNEVDGMSYVAQHVMPKHLRQQRRIKDFAHKHGFFVFSSL